VQDRRLGDRGAGGRRSEDRRAGAARWHPLGGTRSGSLDARYLREASAQVHVSATTAGHGPVRPSLGPRISAIIPTLNEAQNLAHVLPFLPDLIDEVILVDGRSTDGTIAVARELLPDVRVVIQTHRGKGNALACGFAVCTGDIIVMLDADGSTDPTEIPLFIAELLAGADFVKGSRYMKGGGSEDLTRVRRYGNAFLTGTVNALFGVRYTDLCYGYIAFWRRCLPQLTVDCTGFEVETLLTVRAARSGLEVTEVPSVEHNRISGESNLRPVHDGLRVLRTIMRERIARNRIADRSPAWAALVGELDDVSPALVSGQLGVARVTGRAHESRNLSV